MNEFVEKLIARLEEKITENTNDDMSYRIPYFGLCDAIEIINELTEEYNNGWISVSERLPEKNGEYLVQNIHGVICVAHYNYKSPCTYRAFFVGYTQVKNPVAWQPLPNPYKKKESNIE